MYVIFKKTLIVCNITRCQSLNHKKYNFFLYIIYNFVLLVILRGDRLTIEINSTTGKITKIDTFIQLMISIMKQYSKFSAIIDSTG